MTAPATMTATPDIGETGSKIDIINLAPAPTVRPFTERLLDLLKLFDTSRGVVQVDIRTLHGVGHERFGLSLPIRALPRALLDSLDPNANRAIRMHVTTTDAGISVNLAFVFVVFRPATRFDASTDWRHAVDPASQAAIRDALARFPLAPAMLIDAGPEVWCAWPLSSPIPAGAPALSLLSRFAERLGSDAETARDLTTITLPLAGVIRNFGTWPPIQHVEILDVDPARRYTVQEIEAALAPPTSEPTEPIRRKGART